MDLQELQDELKKLSEKEIDDFFYNCNWIDSEHGKNKALPDQRIDEIKRGNAVELLDTFIQETGNKKISDVLNEIK